MSATPSDPASSAPSAPDGPLIVQSDKSVLLEVAHPQAGQARRAIAAFAELERAPEHIHTYRITPLALWNARAAGLDAETVVHTLITYSRFPVPHALLTEIAETMSRYGRLQLLTDPAHGLVLHATDMPVLEEVMRSKRTKGLLGTRLGEADVVVHPSERGHLKQVLIKLGWPAEDLAGYVDGEAHPITLTDSPDTFQLRPYQRSMAKSSTTTLILVTNAVSARQWKEELIRFTTLTEEEIGEYSGSRKEVRPVTIATYQVLTTRRKGVYPHLDLLDSHDWGLIVYDEVHLLPAPIFRMTADLQARRRLGLTATLVREDGREDEVFSLIGPKRYDAPWKDLENQGWIAPAICTEVRLTLDAGERMAYATAEPDERYRLAACSPRKLPIIDALLARHKGESALVIGQYVDQLTEIAEHLDAPVITGATTVRERQRLYDAFRCGEIRTLVVSKVANFSIDLPGASVAIQVSGSFGSRQEEAQRLGRIVRPKEDGRQAHFYTVVARDTADQEYAAHRQRFLAEQGYAYAIIDSEDLTANS